LNQGGDGGDAGVWGLGPGWSNTPPPPSKRIVNSDVGCIYPHNIDFDFLDSFFTSLPSFPFSTCSLFFMIYLSFLSSLLSYFTLPSLYPIFFLPFLLCIPFFHRLSSILSYSLFLSFHPFFLISPCFIAVLFLPLHVHPFLFPFNLNALHPEIFGLFNLICIRPPSDMLDNVC